MNAAALMLMVAALGVGSGWQPLPVDSARSESGPRSEFIIAIEPEMLDALARGASVPIVCEVPADAGSVARVRVVVGDPALPQRKAVTQLKPVVDEPTATPAAGTAAATIDENIVLTQYTQQDAARYGAPIPVTQPAAANGATFDPYTQVPPATAAGGGSWNADATANNALRTTAASDPIPPAGSWNGGVAPVTGDASSVGPLGRVGASIQNATQPLTQPLQDGFDRFGNRVQTAVQNVGERTDRLIDELGQPLQPGGLLRPGTTAPPAATATAGTAAPGWNGGAVAPSTTSQPFVGGGSAVPPAGGWNGGATTPPVVGANAPYTPPYGSAPYGSPAPPLANGGTTPTGAANADPWANPGDPRLVSNPAPAAGNTTWPGADAPSGSTVLQPPPLPATPGSFGQGGPLLSGPAGTTSGLGTPEVKAGMLALPSDRTLDGVTPNYGSSAITPPPANNIFAPNVAGTTPATGAANGGSLLGSQGWPSTLNTPPATTAAANQAPAAATSQTTDPRQQAVVLFAWVTLFASVAGNIYLFWSYLDVRTKYRALVRKTARAVGSRFSAA